MKNNKPFWLNIDHECVWCCKIMKLDDSFVSETKDSVHGIFVCENSKCDYLKKHEKEYKMTIIYEGKGSVESYESKAKQSEVKNETAADTGSFEWK